MPSKGVPIVLSADRTILADYRVLLDGMLAASQTTTTPSLLMRTLLAPRLNSADCRAPRAPLGLRRIEAALRRDGFSADDVSIVTPENLKHVIGPGTRIIGVSSGDPLGLGMNSNTMTGIAGGGIYTARWFSRLLARIHSLKPSDARLVMGGPGAWQLAAHPDRSKKLGIHHVVTGYAESEIVGIFRRILANENLPFVIPALTPETDSVPRILGPTVMGAVEISRACGLGCDFCTQARRPMSHFSPDSVLADARTNLQGGVHDLSLVTEDFFRYGALSPSRPEPEKLISLLEGLRELPGLRSLQPDHASVSAVAAFSDDQLARVRGLLAGSNENALIWVNLGVETASGKLLAASGGRAKMHPFSESDWPDASHRQVQRLCRAGFLPMVSLVLGLPNETPDDVRRTLDWVQSLRGERLTIFPMFLAPLSPETPSFSRANMTADHWRLLRIAYRFNFKWVPRLFADNQTRARVPRLRRWPLQVLGRFNVLFWKSLFVLRSGKLTP